LADQNRVSPPTSLTSEALVAGRTLPKKAGTRHIRLPAPGITLTHHSKTRLSVAEINAAAGKLGTGDRITP
jgi:hypothetical protein